MLDSILCRCEKILRPGVNRSGPKLEQRRHLFTRIQSSSYLVVDFRFGSIPCLHYSRKYYENLLALCDDSLSRPKQRSIAPAHKSIQYWRFVCERKPYPICFWCRHTSYSVWCRHTVRVEGDTKWSHFSTIKATAMKNRERVNVRALRFTE